MKELVGRWSTYEYDGYGSMEDELIAFREDGTGWRAFDRGVLCERTKFKWVLSDENTLSIAEYEYAGMSSSPEDPPRIKAIDNPIAKIHFKIERMLSKWPDPEELQVLIFSEQTFVSSTHFARVVGSENELQYPLFESEKRPNQAL